MKLRIQITKLGDVRFISHLEYARTLNRALRRAKLPVAYSEGFNPHIKMSLASALGVGIASLSEYAEIELAQEISPEQAMLALNHNLPPGIRVLACDVIDKKSDRKLMAMLAGATYEIKIPFYDQKAFIAAVDKYNALEQCVYTKKTSPKKPAKQVDVKAFVALLECAAIEDGMKVTFDCKITPLGTLKAYDILSVLKEIFTLDFEILACDVTRTALYKDGKQPLLTSSN